MKKLAITASAMLLLCLSLSAKDNGRLLGENHLIMPKKTISLGLQGSYFDISGSDASVMLLLRRLNASGSYFGVSPYFSWCYSDNRCVGVKIKYSDAQGGIAGMEVNLPGSDMELGASDLNASSTSFIGEVFHRTYMGLDERGRFGLFVDLALQYGNSRLAYGSSSELGTDFTVSQSLKAVVRPGLEVFVMNNVSSVFSIGVGGIHGNMTKNCRNGVWSGKSLSSGARFMPDVTDISMGVAVHF